MSKIKLHTNTLKVRNKQGRIVDVPVLAGRSAVYSFKAKSDFPVNGETGIIYVDESQSYQGGLYRWTGYKYVPLFVEPTLACETVGDTLEIKLVYDEYTMAQIETVDVLPEPKSGMLGLLRMHEGKLYVCHIDDDTQQPKWSVISQMSVSRYE